MAKAKARAYDASDLKEVMDNTGGWAQSWDDVLRYLRGPAEHDADFAKDEIPALIKDIENLKKRDIKFTSDYRDVWKEISGETGKDLPPPEGVKKPPTNPIELEDRYLKGLTFPAKRDEVLKTAKSNDAPGRVIEVLEKLENETWKDMGSLLESIGDLAWDHD